MKTMNEAKKNSVLIVDDQNTNIMALTNILNTDYTIYAAKSGEAAIKAAKKRLPDVILLDIIMPGMDGYDVLAVLKSSEKTQNIPVIFISGLSNAVDEEKGLTLGAADYISKPFNSEIIRLRVQNQITFARLHAAQYDLINYKLASNAMNIAMWSLTVVTPDPTSPENKIIWSQEMRHMLGFSDESDFPNTIEAFAARIHPEDSEMAFAAFAAHFNDRTGKTSYNIEYRLKHKNGEYRYYDGFGTTLRDSEGIPLRVSGTVRDITERKRAEESLKHREVILSALNKTAAIFLTKSDGTFEEIMSLGVWQLADLFGIDRFSLFRNFVMPDGLYTSQIYRWERKSGGTTQANKLFTNMPYAKVAPNWEIVLKDDDMINGPVKFLPSPEAETLNAVNAVSVLISPVFTDQKFWGFALFEDHNNERYFDDNYIEMMRSAAFLCATTVMRNEMELEIAESNKRLALMLDSTPMCCQLFDSNLKKIDCNQEALRLFGFKDKKEFFERYKELYPEHQPDGQDSVEKVTAYLKRALVEGRCTFEWIYTMLDGTLMPAEATLVRLKHGDDYVIAGYTRDLREYYKILEEKDKAAIAEEISRAKSAFLANMSHEIRTPMNAVLGITEILMQNESLPYETTEGLRRVLNSCNLLMGIINDILDFSKIEAGKLDIIPAEYSTASLLNDSIHLNMMLIGEKLIEFEVEIDENIPANLIGDELRIKQILNNLLSNAFKYTDTGKVTLSITCEPGSPPHDNMVFLVFNVRDTGHGMTEEQVSRLFDEYSRFNQEYNRTIEGTGLGLAIAKRMTSLMDGKIHVESEPGSGSLFILRLPQSKVDSEILGHELTEHLRNFRSPDSLTRGNNYQILREPMPYGSVLIVDDVETNLYVAKMLMKPYGLQIETVMSGFGAIEKIIDEGKVYDIVFMDHMMPKMNGMETTKRLRDSGYQAPIAALTANALVGQADIFLQSGFDAFISKPIDIRQLNSVLNKLIRDKQPPEVIEAARSQKNNAKENNHNGLSFDQSAAALLLGGGISGLNTADGLERYDGDVKTYLKILRLYAASTNSMLDTIENVSEDKLKDYEITVHGIKGSSFDIFAGQIGEEAKRLEEAAKDGDLDYIAEHNPLFLEAARKLICDISNVISAASIETPKPKKDKPDSEALKRLAAACEVYSINEVNAAMEEIEGYRYESDDDLVKWLRDNVDIMNYSQIVQKLSDNNK
ncbi:MAG: response regulator [Oscillospiraceae bacterium]|jgi:PAS domain S-box-containing protein|nr:response regulator [Oscillospiraceae bacterium]